MGPATWASSLIPPPCDTAVAGSTRSWSAWTRTGDCSPSCWRAGCPGVRYEQPPGTCLAWLDCRALGLGDDPAAVFLDRGRVALSGGTAFGAGGAGHVRLNLGASPEVIIEAVRRMAAALG
jgi:bifunctional pyridoxal-dependent enzyme with beta-cystathionase and maltose regulon repressor activities